MTIPDRDRAAIELELDRLAVALRDRERPECYREFYAAQQALAWALSPDTAASPFNTITGIQGVRVDYSAESRQPSS